ncbi:heterokaryon incompatibility protein-domain-containing protein [Triangularia verruculosa]|uniref:Heterokaryon incompatibility protein-domain-containing protein n=1 Tax=Triangularia verruculosa TaxID=2587418 RepID=A0AAN6XE17_9PEZI|nr:heterokaryon incompatibility protein-domain-containing protein [Triangularia verruculosa]
MEFTKEWMLRCQDHPVCSSTRLSASLPKRILDISAPDGTVVLRETQAEKGSYATLSYRWGNGVPLRTTHSTIAQHYGGIPLESFPKTLRDAIIFAKELGFYFIWIDALCIIQGDSLDWQEQSAAMTAIYQGCLLNIAIATAPNCDCGIMQDINCHRMDHSEWLSSIWSTHTFSALETRGWVFQETLVSVASVYVTDAGLVWDCCSAMCCQNWKPYITTGATESNKMSSKTPKATWADQSLVSRPDPTAAKTLSALRVWYEWVALFSRRYLSKASDKLPAIAGLASRLRDASAATYVARLWKEDIHIGLSWLGRESESLKRLQNGTPSWSWASVEGDLEFPSYLSVYCGHSGRVFVGEGLDMDILTVSAKEVHPGTFGTVVSGCIEAVATMQKGIIDGSTGRLEFKFDLTKSLSVRYRLDELQDRSDGPRPCWLLRVASIIPQLLGRLYREADRLVMFLIVEETGNKTDEFRRIGGAHGSYEYSGNIGLQTDIFKNGERKVITLV